MQSQKVGALMAWIEVHQALLTHWKTRELAEDIGVLDLYAAAHLISLWTWALDNAPEGDLSHLRPGTVSRAAQWQGDADEFLESLVRSQWLDREGDTLRLHDWYQYAGKLIERRKEDAARKRSTRHPRPNGPSGNTAYKEEPGTSNGRPEDIQRTSDVTVPNPTVQKNTVQNQENGGGTTNRAAAREEVDPPSTVPISPLTNLDETTRREVEELAGVLEVDIGNPTLIRALLKAVGDYQRVDAVAVAADYMAWQSGQKMRHKNRVSGFRNQLEQKAGWKQFQRREPEPPPGQREHPEIVAAQLARMREWRRELALSSMEDGNAAAG